MRNLQDKHLLPQVLLGALWQWNHSSSCPYLPCMASRGLLLSQVFPVLYTHTRAHTRAHAHAQSRSYRMWHCGSQFNLQAIWINKKQTVWCHFYFQFAEEHMELCIVRNVCMQYLAMLWHFICSLSSLPHPYFISLAMTFLLDHRSVNADLLRCWWARYPGNSPVPLPQKVRGGKASRKEWTRSV